MDTQTNGRAMAAFLAAGIGTFTLGLFVVLHIVGLFSAPAVYGPAGGASGRTAFAVAVWLIAWAALHVRWKDREVDPRHVSIGTLVLIALGIAATFPPLWGLLE